MANSPGKRVACEECGGEVIVTTGGDGTVTCNQGGSDAGYGIGKRFKCESCGTQVLVSKPSEVGELVCCGESMGVVEAKQLASSD